MLVGFLGLSFGHKIKLKYVHEFLLVEKCTLS